MWIVLPLVVFVIAVAGHTAYVFRILIEVERNRGLLNFKFLGDLNFGQGSLSVLSIFVGLLISRVLISSVFNQHLELVNI